MKVIRCQCKKIIVLRQCQVRTKNGEGVNCKKCLADTLEIDNLNLGVE